MNENELQTVDTIHVLLHIFSMKRWGGKKKKKKENYNFRYTIFFDAFVLF